MMYFKTAWKQVVRYHKLIITQQVSIKENLMDLQIQD